MGLPELMRKIIALYNIYIDIYLYPVNCCGCPVYYWQLLSKQFCEWSLSLILMTCSLSHFQFL